MLAQSMLGSRSPSIIASIPSERYIAGSRACSQDNEITACGNHIRKRRIRFVDQAQS